MQNSNINNIVVDKYINQKIGYKKIAKELGISYSKVSTILINNGIVKHINMPSQDIVDKIIELYKTTRLKEIAKELHISVDKIKAILLINNVSLREEGYHINSDSHIQHNYFEIIDSEHKAYWLGFLYADGYNNEKMYQIEFALKKDDRYILEQFKKDIDAQYDIKNRKILLNDKQYESSRLIVYSKKMSIDLAKNGCMNNKTLKIRFPYFISQEYYNHFMRGYFDGDGCISNSKFMVISNMDFLNEYVNVLTQNTDISLAGKYYPQGDNGAFVWQHSSKRDLTKIYNFLYKDATIYLKRKKQLFEKNMIHKNVLPSYSDAV